MGSISREKVVKTLTKEFQLRNIWTWAAVYNQVIQNLKSFHRSRSETHNLLVPTMDLGLSISECPTRPASLESLPTAFLKVFHHDFSCVSFFYSLMLFALPIRDSTINSTSEAHPEVNTDAIVDYRVYDIIAFGKVKVGQETQRT
jgi:hypothetical protein